MPDDKDMPNRASKMEKADGDRWTSDPDSVEVADRYEHGVGNVSEDTGGISNRELTEEIERQHNLPERGTSREDRHADDEGDAER